MTLHSFTFWHRDRFVKHAVGCDYHISSKEILEKISWKFRCSLRFPTVAHSNCFQRFMRRWRLFDNILWALHVFLSIGASDNYQNGTLHPTPYLFFASPKNAAVSCIQVCLRPRDPWESCACYNGKMCKKITWKWWFQQWVSFDAAASHLTQYKSWHLWP